MASRALAVWQNRKVVNLLVRRDLKVKYQKSFLGWAWSMLEPLAMAAVYYFVFGLIFQVNRGVPGGDDAPGGYPLFLISGLLPWLWFSGALGQSPRALLTHSKLITTMQVPREIFPLATVATRFADYLFTWPVLIAFVIFLGGRTHWEGVLLWLPLAIVVQFSFTLGVTLLLASINVLVPDVERIVRILNRVLFYASAIIIPSAMVLDSESFPEWFKTLYQLNPLLGIFKMHHAIWFPADAPSAFILSTSIGGAVLMLFAGYFTFRRLETAVLKEI
ncbi:ABC-2 type transport system permease protein [Lipingzhangella halophila]|uniref:Transport permease protein n=1 Tax=Lipingzhangella halophila TaxID=1783352 RepID=A0A7W7W5M1_9ACTN|nr:ABC transporter permease [Lipingzhangella halophila]MBB4933945.1 ABC-2 type transport system permease protein [Lipingzhangella halophila]